LMRRVNAAAALVICGAVVGVAYTLGRANRRWEADHRPFAGTRARLKRERGIVAGAARMIAARRP
jgi:hypothetical protein